MKLVLTGIQGSGKSTQGNLLQKQLGIPYLSTGHIFRNIAKEKTQLGKYIKTVMNSGALIPDDKTIEIVNDYLSRREYHKGYILDGFPRTLEQAKKFVNNVDKVIYLEITDKEAVWRLAYRKDDDRDDNTIQALRKRMELFHTLTMPVIKYYRKEKKLVEIDGMQSVEEINEEILKSLGKQIVKNQVESWKQDEKAIIAIVGLPGAGKTEAAEFFKEKNIPVISFSKIINDQIEKKKLKHTEENHKFVREGLRAEKGMDVLAKLSKKKILAELKDNMIIVIDGMRSWEEYTYLNKQLKNVKVYILSLFADKDIRYHRISTRGKRKGLYGSERDINELIGVNMGPTIAYADFVIKNNFSRQDLFDKLDDVYREVYFS